MVSSWQGRKSHARSRAGVGWAVLGRQHDPQGGDLRPSPSNTGPGVCVWGCVVIATLLIASKWSLLPFD